MIGDVAEAAVAGASIGSRRAGRRLGWLVGIVAVAGLVFGYLFLAVLSHPLVPGNAEGASEGPLQPDPASSPGGGTQIRVFTYVDGKTVTMIKWLGNSGLVPLTLTGVDTVPSGWRHLMGVTGARAVPVVESRGCCRYDDPAPWAASSFQPLVVQPGQQGAVILHILMSNCEFSAGGGIVGFGFGGIGVHYSVLGMPRSDYIPFFNPVSVNVPDTCPRSAR
jgi:hypothetical protein